MKRILLSILLVYLGYTQVSAQALINTIGNTGDLFGESGDGGPATAAGMYPLWGMCYDSKGNLYFTSANGHTIRKIDTFGIVTHVAGTGKVSSGRMHGDGGPAAVANLNDILDIEVDAADNLYLLEHMRSSGGGAIIRKIDIASGILSTIAGDTTLSCLAPGLGDGGFAIDACLLNTYDMDIDRTGNIYLAQDIPPYVRGVRKIDVSGRINTVVSGMGIYTGKPGSGDGGPANLAYLETPHWVAVDAAGNLFIGDQSVRELRIRKVNSRGIISTYAGGGTLTSAGVPATSARILPDVMDIDNAGNLYFCSNAQVKKVDRSTGLIHAVAGSGFWGTSGDGGDPLLAKIATGGHSFAFNRLTKTSFAFGNNRRIRSITGLKKEADQDPNLVDEETSVAQVSTAPQASIYPNPVIDGLHIDGVKVACNMSLSDIAGRVLITKELSTGNHIFSIESLASGMYQLSLTELHSGIRHVTPLWKK